MIVWPWLNGVPSIKKAPVVWILILLNLSIFCFTHPLQNAHQDKVDKLFSTEFKTEIANEYSSYLKDNDTKFALKKAQYMKKEVATEFLALSSFSDEQFRKTLGENNLTLSEKLNEVETLESGYPIYKWSLKYEDPWSHTILSHLFIHDGWFHVILNMLFFIFFGAAVEMKIGSKNLLAIYLLVGVVSSLIYVLVTKSNLVGASGPISAIFGFWLGIEKSNRVRYFYCILPVPKLAGFFIAPAWFSLLFWVLTDISYSLNSNTDVAHGVHLLNFVIGFGLSLYRVIPRS